MGPSLSAIRESGFLLLTADPSYRYGSTANLFDSTNTLEEGLTIFIIEVSVLNRKRFMHLVSPGPRELFRIVPL